MDQTYTEFLTRKNKPEELTSDLRQLVIQDSASGFRWCDLGESLMAGGDVETAAYCIRRAVMLNPNSALVLLRAANVQLRIGDNAEALPLFARILRLTPEFDQIVFSTMERFGGTADTMLKLGIPADRRAGQAFLRHLITNHRPSLDIHKTWDWLTQHAWVDRESSVEYVNYLVASRQLLEAPVVWRMSVGSKAGDYLHPNLVFNGDFELDPSGAVLDWQTLPSEGVQLTWTENDSHSGQRALRLDFDAEQNLSFKNIYQEVVVAPGQYVFEAFVRSDHLTTDQGVGFHIFDLEAPTRFDVFLAPVLGTTDWIQQTTTFSVPPKTKLIRIELRREYSHKFDNKIKGTLWVDAVKLYPTL